MRRLLLTGLLLGGMAAQAQRIEAYSADRLMQRVTRSRDTVYIVNFWATWCGPCVRELPVFDTLSRRYAGAPVKVLLVSFDFPNEYKTKLPAFIAKKKPLPEIVWFRETDANYFIPKIDDRWSGALPATLILRGDKRFFQEDVVHVHSLAATVDSLLHP